MKSLGALPIVVLFGDGVDVVIVVLLVVFVLVVNAVVFSTKVDVFSCISLTDRVVMLFVDTVVSDAF